MEKEVLPRRYRPIFKQLKIGTKDYWVLDKEQASERAQYHLQEALDLLEHSNLPAFQDTINQELTLATDFGCSEAPFLLALQILGGDTKELYGDENVIIFLKLAAERGNPNAAYRLAAAYAGMGNFETIEEVSQDYLAPLSPTERERLAEYYFERALDAKHQEATEELIMAYAYGRGYLHKNSEKFQQLCERLIKEGNQAVMLGYGAWLLGMTVEAQDPLPDAITLTPDPQKGLDYLIEATHFNHYELAQHALHLIFVALERGAFDKRGEDKIRKKLLKEAVSGNQLVALYFAWYSISAKGRRAMPKFMEPYPLTGFSQLIEPNDSFAIQFLDTTLFGEDEVIAEVAREVLVSIFGENYSKEDSYLLMKR